MLHLEAMVSKRDVTRVHKVLHQKVKRVRQFARISAARCEKIGKARVWKSLIGQSFSTEVGFEPRIGLVKKCPQHVTRHARGEALHVSAALNVADAFEGLPARHVKLRNTRASSPGVELPTVVRALQAVRDWV